LTHTVYVDININRAMCSLYIVPVQSCVES